jgi:hypothetical protein
MEHAEIRMVNCETICVEGTLSAVEKELSDAARSGSSRFAWFTREGSGQQIGVNPDHVVSLRLSDGLD